MKRIPLLFAACGLLALVACGSPRSQDVNGQLAANSRAATPGAAPESVDKRTTTTHKPHRTTTTDGRTSTTHHKRTTTTSSPSTSVPGPTGIAGVVLSGQTCTTGTTTSSTRCGERPDTASLKLYDSANKVVARGNTDSHGAFVLSVPAGTYTLKASLTSGANRCAPVSVTVPSSGYVNVAVHCND